MDLTPLQIERLNHLQQAGFRLYTLERYARHFGVERDGFTALIDPSDGQLKTFGQTGYRLGEGIAMLVDRGAGKAFVWHNQAVDATPELLTAYDRFRADLERLLSGQ